MDISSVSNPRIKALVRLRQRSHRDKEGLLLIEGYRELKRALAAEIAIQELYFSPAYFLGENEGKLIEAAEQGGAKLFRLEKAPFKKISYRDRPDGLIATAPKLNKQLSDLSFNSPGLFVIAERIEKPGNLGSILRIADAVGADGVLVCDKTTDINNPNVVRASTGTLFHVPVVETSVEAAFDWLRQNDIRILAATPHAKETYTDPPLEGSLAIAVGAEQYGLTDRFMEAADLKVKIPMAGIADSLNVATAAAVLLFEAARQRGFPMKKIGLGEENP